MEFEAKWFASRCRKLHELPLVASEWQQTTWRPDCVYYDCGFCARPNRADASAPCPHDGKALPLRPVAEEMPGPSKLEQRFKWKAKRTSLDAKALEHAIKLKIMARTARRIRALVIELTDRELVLHGTAPCYYVKQLALQGALDVLNADAGNQIECKSQIIVRPPQAMMR